MEMPRIKNWTRMTAEELYHDWAAQFEGEDEAIATAIWIANRLVKGKAVSTRWRFYSIKEEWIYRNRKNLVEGRMVRKEGQECWECHGTGKVNYRRDSWDASPDEGDEDYDYDGGYDSGYGGSDADTAGEGRRRRRRTRKGRCWKCEGSGLYPERILYGHRLVVAGQWYSFHSYVGPEKLSDEPGADCEEYGGRFSEEELDELALPMSGLLKILAFVARARWKMDLDKRHGRYLGSYEYSQDGVAFLG